MIDRSAHARSPLGHAQAQRRDAERDLRKRVIALARLASLPGICVASHLCIAPRTIRSWSASWPRDRLPARPRGRPTTRVDPALRQDVEDLLDTHGLALGLPALKGLFPAVPRTMLGAWRWGWRDDLRRQASRDLPPPCRLLWTRPGAVWSTDFTRPPCHIDGVFSRILLVRDLASHRTLLALPALHENSSVVAHALALLFAQHGPPLVLKSDNGPPFIAAVITCLLAHHGVVHLRSPAYTPSYNGSVESAGGWLKARTASIAACSEGSGHGLPPEDHRACHPRTTPTPPPTTPTPPTCPCWTSDHVEAARLLANAANRPWGATGPTPDQRWEQRTPAHATPNIRELFTQRVESFRRSIAASFLQPPPTTTPHLPPQLPPHLPCDPPRLTAGQQSSVDRAATRQALVELGFLIVRSPSLLSTHSPPKNGKD